VIHTGADEGRPRDGEDPGPQDTAGDTPTDRGKAGSGFNVSNFARLNTSLDGAPGDINGTPKGSEPTRVGQGSGSFSPGIQRAFQFGIRVSF